MKNKKMISILSLVCIGLVLLIPFLNLAIMSFTDFSAYNGLLGSPFVGFANIAEVLSKSGVTRVMKNTVVISILSLFVGAAYIFVAFPAIGASHNRIVKTGLTIIFALPAMIPVNTYIIILQTILPREVLIQSSVLLQMIAAVEYGVRFSAVFVIGALFVRGNILREATKYSLLFVSLRLINILTVDTTFMNSFYNPLTYEHLDTYGSYLHRLGFMQSDFSVAAAGYIVRLLAGLLPAVIGLFLLVMLFREKTSLNNSSGNFGPFILFAVLPMVLLVLAVVTGTGDFFGFELPRVRQAYIYGIVIAVVSAGVVVTLGMLLAYAIVHLGMAGVLIVAALYFVSDNLLGYYISGRSIGMLNSIAGVVFQNMYLTAPIALIGAFIMKADYSVSRIFTVSGAAMGLAFAWFWGDHMSALVALHSTDKYPISVVMYQVGNSQNAAGYSSGPGQLTAILYILIPILAAGACIGISSFGDKQA